MFSSLFFRVSPLLRFVIKDHSMEPTLCEGDQVLVWKWGKLKKEDIIIFSNEEKYIVKRIKKIDKDLFFVQGDNVIDTKTFGGINKKNIIGKVILKI